ncbi:MULTISPECIES: hypothetical protein [unclassified Caballeronia]|uniref:hypothetical protein n=1 Tax=unclassified Caballeronia TaxID=2646786 RepID=UPI002027F76D|nr:MULTISPECIES: hypothetical protein [unclassified Caballeronia]
MDRFWPDGVVSGLGGIEEDFVDTLISDGIVLRMVKPCARCPITTIVQTQAERDERWPNEPLDTMLG